MYTHTNARERRDHTRARLTCIHTEEDSSYIYRQSKRAHMHTDIAGRGRELTCTEEEEEEEEGEGLKKKKTSAS